MSGDAQPFNGLTPAEAERLALLAEECGEVVLAIGKILRHGFESTHPDGGVTNRESLAIETAHIRAAYRLMIREGDLSEAAMNYAYTEKTVRMHRYLHHQRSAKQRRPRKARLGDREAVR